jgi:mono/diheme cytochrome c family protein
MIEDLAFTPDGRALLLPALAVKNLVPILQVARGWVMTSVLFRVDVATGDVRALPLTGAVEGFGDPTGIALAPDGRRAWVAAGGADEVALLDLEAFHLAAKDAPEGSVQRLADTRRYLASRFPVGSNPRAVLALPGERLAVTERLGDAVGLYAAADGRLLGRVPLGARRADDAVQRGARAFHDARVAFQSAFSCRSCHPEGHTDGLTYDFEIDGVGRDVVLNRSLRGVAGTDPFKWVGSNPTIQRQCGARFAMVLTRADVFPEDRLNDLVAYIHSLPAPRPDPLAGQVAGRDTGAVGRGKAIFERSTRKDGSPIPSSGRCITCHPPPHYTSRRRADVGTRGPRDSTGLFDTPHLTGIGSKAPYLHDGRAATLEEIWTLPGVLDQHGVMTDLDKTELNDLIQYLRGL